MSEVKVYAYLDTAGIESLFAQTLGAKVEVAKVTKIVEEADFALTPEQKLNQLVSYLSASYKLNANFQLALEDAKATGSGTFVRGNERFDAPQFYSNADGITKVSEEGVILFEALLSSSKLVMAASLTNMPTAAGRIAMLSHLAALFSTSGGKNIPLDVFGYLVPISESVVQIKPYSISL